MHVMKKSESLAIRFTVAKKVAKEFGTPVYVYDEAGLRSSARELQKAFGWAKGYRNYFAVKATPTPAILQILLEEGMGLDCSSRAELLMAERLGVPGERIFYTSNNTPQEDFELAIQLGATVNIDDLSQLPVFIKALAGKHLDRVAVRYNPGKLKKGNSLIGDPINAKYGMRLDQLAEAFTELSKQAIGEFGLHTMVASNELDPKYFAETAQVLLHAVDHVEKETVVRFSFINLGGGFGLGYEPDQEPFDAATAAKGIKDALQASGHKLQVFTENGRYVTGPHGYLLTRVRYVMRKYKTYVGLDASMHNLMRPGMYGSYHHLTVLDADGREAETYDVVGSLCENNDKFAVDRTLPAVEPGDYVVVHDVGAHGHAMGFNYNGLLRSPEVLLHQDGVLELIRKGETPEDYFRNIIWPKK